MKCQTCGGNRTPDECKLCDLFAAGWVTTAQSSAGWPKTSDSLAVHPSQAKEAYEQSVRLGVPTEFRPDGRPVLTDPGHQRRFAKALGFQDVGERVITKPKFRSSIDG